jgi:hypothetical protein
MKEGQDVSLGIQNRALARLLDHLELDTPRITAMILVGQLSFVRTWWTGVL